MNESSSGDGTEPDFEEAFKEDYDEKLKGIGRFNLAIFGNTGVGKSSLVNAIFKMVVADTGIGKPVTKGTQYFEHPSGVFGVFDCEGFETGADGDEILRGLRVTVEGLRSRPIREQIHVGWYVIRWSDRRFEDSQADFIRQLRELGLPVIIVLSQVPLTGPSQAHPDAEEFADQIATEVGDLVVGGRPLLTNAVEDPHLNLEVHGLQPLLKATRTAAPEGVEAALDAAQRIDMERKRAACKAIIVTGSIAAASVAAVPIPFADAPLLKATQVAMMTAITAKYGLPVSSGTLATAAGAAVFAGGAAMIGTALANLAKFIPGIGQVVGGGINAAIATTLTAGIGWAWVELCEHMSALSEDELARFVAERKQIIDIFLAAFKNYVRK